MPAFSVAGTTLAIEQFEELEPVTKGELVETFDKTLTSTISDEKRRFRVVSAPVNKTTYDAMETAFANGASFTVTGDVLLGDSVTCRGRISYSLVGIGTADAGYNFHFVLTMTLQEA
jgi:hypothetical protein